MRMDGGATDAECTIAEGDEFSANVRMREVESSKEAGSRGAGLRILIGRHTGSAYTSDLSHDGIAHMVKSAHRAGRDHDRRSPRRAARRRTSSARSTAICGLYSADVERWTAAVKIERAKRAEAAALAADPRIANSEGASFDTHIGSHVFANSRGFCGSYRTSYCSLSTVPVAQRGRIDGARLLVHHGARLRRARERRRGRPQRRRTRPPPAERVKVETQKVPVIFEPRAARSLLDNIFEAVTGSVYRTNPSWPGNWARRSRPKN